MMRADKAGEFATTRRPDRRTRLATGALATAALLALVTACGTTEPGPTASPTTSLSATPSPTPTATALAEPTKPPEMERNDEVGAVAAAEYFMELYEYVIATGDFTVWTQVASANCEFCTSIAETFGAVYDAGGTYVPGDFSADARVNPVRSEQFGGFPVFVDLFVGSGTQFDGSGAEVAITDEEDIRVIVDVAFLDQDWVFVELSTTSEP